MDDELEALYGDAMGEADEQHAAPATESAVPEQQQTEDESLFAELYGAEPDAEPAVAAPAPVIVAPVAGLGADAAALYGDADIEDGEPAAASPAALPGSSWQAAAAAAAADHQPAGVGSEDEDDLVINLDENATAYEPTAGSRFQYQRQGAGPRPATGAPPSDAVGAAPGQHIDVGGDVAPALPGFGGFGSRTAIGGIPRSAIPGLGGSLVTSVPMPSGPGGQPAAGGGAVPGHGPPGAAGGPPGRPAFRPQMRSANLADAVFPSQQRPGLPVKLPGQTRVSPEEYREFLNLGHGDIFSLDVDAVVDAPWRYPGIDPGDFFNYGLTERTWKEYCAQIEQYRQEFMLQGQIQTLDAVGPPQLRRGGERDGGQQRQGGGVGTAAASGGEGAGEGGTLTLGTMGEQEDAQYEAFVTSERPPRSQWTRHGSSWDHIQVLANAEIVFEEDKPSSSSLPETEGTRPEARRAQDTRGPPPPPSAAAAAAAAAQAAARAAAPAPGVKQEPGGGLAAPAVKAEDGGASLSAANGGGAFFAGAMPMPAIPGMAFPPTMMAAAAAAMGMPFGMMPFMQGVPGVGGQGEPGVSGRPNAGSELRDAGVPGAGPSASKLGGLAAGMDIDLPPPVRQPHRPPDRPPFDRGPPPDRHFDRGPPGPPERFHDHRGPPPSRFDRGPSGPPDRFYDRGPPDRPPPGRFDRGPPPAFWDERRGPPRQRSRTPPPHARSPAQRSRSPGRDRDRDRRERSSYSRSPRRRRESRSPARRDRDGDRRRDSRSPRRDRDRDRERRR